MIIVGTGGLGKEILGILVEDGYTSEIVFFDENLSSPSLLYNKFRVYHHLDELKQYIETSHNEFIVGIGQPRIRQKLASKIMAIGGIYSSVISCKASPHPFNDYPQGTIIEPFAGISHGLKMGTGCAIHVSSSIGHAAEIGEFVNVGPGATVIGPVTIGSYSYIGAQAVVLPGITIGKNAFISPGAVVDRTVADYETYTR